MAEIVRLTDAGPLLEPEQTVIAMFENLLKAAKAGEIKGAGVFYTDRANNTCSEWATGCASATQMVAGASRLQFSVLQQDDVQGIVEPVPPAGA